jgi:hypothetical protein
MRTTVSIDTELLKRAKERAHRTGKSLSRVLEDALRSDLGRKSSNPRQAFRLITFGGSGAREGVSLHRLTDFIDAEDASLFRIHEDAPARRQRPRIRSSRRIA